MDKPEIECLVRVGCDFSNLESEISFRQKVVYPLLKSMGWEDSDIESQKKVPSAEGNSKIADYFIRKKNISIVIETKKARILEDYNPDHHNQIKNYVRGLNADYGILYDGRMLFLFRPRDSGAIELKYIWQCGSKTDIFDCICKENFPEKLDTFINKLPSLGKLQTVARKELRDHPNDEIIICSTQPEKECFGLECGEEWAAMYNAWRHVKIDDKKRNPAYFALYVGSPKFKITLFAEIEKIGMAGDESLNRALNLPHPIKDKSSQKVIIFKKGSLVRLTDPIEKGPKFRRIYTIFSTLNDFLSAKTLSDLKG
ncbi:MAG: type I restriction enzyme HsdR N-terminal domain-containing protein [Thermoplasmataceae archaeon]|jgi:hypothetical protein